MEMVAPSNTPVSMRTVPMSDAPSTVKGSLYVIKGPIEGRKPLQESTVSASVSV
jgi:hypothetical protein